MRCMSAHRSADGRAGLFTFLNLSDTSAGAFLEQVTQRMLREERGVKAGG